VTRKAASLLAESCQKAALGTPLECRWNAASKLTAPLGT